MYLFKEVKKYDPNTGDPIEVWKRSRDCICDYSGIEMSYNNDTLPWQTYSINSPSDVEPTWEGLRPFNVEDGEIDLYEIDRVHDEFHFHPPTNVPGVELTLMGEAEWCAGVDSPFLKKFKENKFNAEIKSARTISEIMWASRLRVLEHVLSTKKYSPEQLGLIVE